LGGVTKWALEHDITDSVLPKSASSLASEMRVAVKALLAAHSLGKQAKEQQEERKQEAANPIGSQFAYLYQVCRLEG
jgi:hypothetical protein